MPQDPNRSTVSDKKSLYAHVILDIAIEKPLTYKIPDHLINLATEGVRVEVPVRGRGEKGTILNIDTNPPSYPTLLISKILNEDKLITDDLFALATWMKDYYCTNMQKIFKLIIPNSIRKEIKEKTQVLIDLAITKKQVLDYLPDLLIKNPSQALVIELLLKSKKPLFLSDLLRELKISKSPIDSLIKKKILISKQGLIDRSDLVFCHDYFKTKPKQFNEEQQKAFNEIDKSLTASLFQVHLLFGITGSGKTEVYMQLIQKALDQKKGVIILVPEVALTTQLIEKFLARFDKKIAVLHHRLSLGERLDSWNNIHQNKAPIVIGPRSAIFSPLQNLGLIIVDEEHDSSYKQNDEAPAYHGRDVAIMRAKINHCPIVLGSATPSFESYYHAQQKKYQLNSISQRVPGAKLPDVFIVDMKIECQKQGRFTYFSQELLRGIEKRYELGEQTILFLNRRGYHTHLLCKNCSWIHKCPHCDLSLTYHRKEEVLTCHLCNYSAKKPQACPECKNRDHFEFKGYGTEQIERALKAILPNIRTLRIDKDTTQRKNSHETLLKEFRSGKADVLIGTQMITKGLHFPSVTLVGIISIDGSLQIPDFRSSERVFQMITQVAGRSGRSFLSGEVIIQTYLPDNKTIQFAAKQDFVSFYQEEIEMRSLFKYPPFYRIGKIIFSCAEEKNGLTIATEVRKNLLNLLPNEYEISPIIPCGYARVKDQFRIQFFIKGKQIYPISSAIKKAFQSTPLLKGVSIFIDIDPLFTFF